MKKVTAKAIIAITDPVAVELVSKLTGFALRSFC